MPTFVSESVTITGLNVDNGCEKMEIYGMGSPNTLLTTVSASDFIDGVELTGSNRYDAYEIVCLDSSNNAQTSQSITFCSGSVDIGDVTCPNPKSYSGDTIFPGVYFVDLGTETGSVELLFQSFDIPDKFVVQWSGSIVFNSGYVGDPGQTSNLNTYLEDQGYDTETVTNTNPGNVADDDGIIKPGYGSGSFDKSTPYPNQARILVYAPLNNTQWNFTVFCPSGSSNNTVLTASDAPAGGGSCLTGTTSVTGVCMPGQTGTFTTGSFTLSEGHEATVRVAGTFYSGYGSVGLNQTTGQQTAQLLDSSDNVVQNFVMTHTQGTSPGSSTYTPSNYKITTPGDYKLRVYHLGCDNGNGTMTLYVDSCAELSNYETTRNTSVGTTAGVGVGTSFKVVWDTYQYQDAIDAQNLGKWLTGLSSISQNVWYGLDTSLITGGGFKVFDSTPTEEGDVNLLSNSQMRYVNDGLEYFIEVKNVSASGNMHTAFTANDQHKFRIG